MTCLKCTRTESKKWRKGLCNTCYGAYWRNTAKGRENTRNLVEHRHNDPEWKAYMSAYGKLHPKDNKDNHKIPANRYSGLKTKAALKGWDCNLEKDEYFQLIRQACHYCGGTLNPSGVGLDRTDTSKGYIKGNVVPCCYTCNRFKNNLLTKNETEQLLGLLKTLRNGSLWR